MTSNITIVKGSYSVTVHTAEANDDYKNKFKSFTPATTKQNQSNGPKDTKVIDLLMVTHSIQFNGYLKTSTDRDNLIKIFKGAEAEGAPCIVTYDTYPNSPLSLFIEGLTIVETGEGSSANEAKYKVQINFIEGVSA